MLIKNNTHLLAHLFPQYLSATINNTIELFYFICLSPNIYGNCLVKFVFYSK